MYADIVCHPRRHGAARKSQKQELASGMIKSVFSRLALDSLLPVMISAIVAGGCSDQHGSLDKSHPFVSIARAPAAKGGTVTVASVPKSDSPESFYLAI